MTPHDRIAEILAREEHLTKLYKAAIDLVKHGAHEEAIKALTPEPFEDD